MGITKVNEFKTSQSGAKLVSNLPTHPADFYDVARNDVVGAAWEGGEVCYLTTDNRFYVQTATSGVTATWKRKLEQTISA